MADINALDLPQLTELDGSEQFVMFNSQSGKRATAHTVSDYVQGQMVFPDAHGSGLYGAKWDRLTNALTRTRDAAAITTDTTNFCHKGTFNTSLNNPFDAIYPWSEIVVCNVDLVKYRQGYSLMDCITAIYGDPDFTYQGTADLFVGRYRPEFWYKSQEDSNGNVEFLVSQNERIGFIHSEEAIDGISFCVDAGDSKVTSGAGVPLTNIAVSTIHSRAKSSGFTLQDIYSRDAQIVLYLVEYANMNSQAALGDGCASCYRENDADTISNVTTVNGVSQFTVTDSALSSLIYKGTQVDFGSSRGATTYKAVVADFTESSGTYTITLDRELSSLANGMYMSVHGFDACEFPLIGASVGSGSGYIGTNGKANAYYRGVVMYANRYGYTLGIYREGGTGKLWLCPATLDPDDYNAINTSVHKDTGVALPDLTSAAWVTVGGNAQRIPDLAGFMATGTSSGSSSSPVGDQQYVPLKSAGSTILLSGGAASDVWLCGVFCGRWDFDAGYSYWFFAGSPLLKKPQ